MKNELKPCPFCGGEAELKIEKMGRGLTNGKVECKKCGCGTHIYGSLNEKCITAAEAWNRRASDEKSE